MTIPVAKGQNTLTSKQLTRARAKLASAESQLQKCLQTRAKTLVHDYDWLPYACLPLTPQNYQWRRSGFFGTPTSASPQFRMIETPSSWIKVEDVVPNLKGIPDHVSANSVAIGCGLHAVEDDTQKKRSKRRFKLYVVSIHVFYNDGRDICQHIAPVESITLDESGITLLNHIWKSEDVMARYVVKRLEEQRDLVERYGVERVETYLFSDQKKSSKTVLDKNSEPLEDTAVIGRTGWKIFRVFDYTEALMEARRRLEGIRESFDRLISDHNDQYFYWSESHDSMGEIRSDKDAPDDQLSHWILFATDGTEARLHHDGRWFRLDAISNNLKSLFRGHFEGEALGSDVDMLLRESVADTEALLNQLRSDGPLAATAKKLASYANEN